MQGKRISITVGTGFDRDGNSLTSWQVGRAREAVEREFLTQFGGYTTIAGTGGWKGPKGVVVEPCLTFTAILDSDKPRSLYHCAKTAKISFNQASVLSTTETVEYEFIK